MLLAAWPCAAQPDAGELLRRMTQAEKSNRQQSACFVYREDIRSSTARAGQLPKQTGWITYEVTILEGEVYHRPVARDGRPLSPEHLAAEEKRFQLVSEYRRTTPVEERRRRFFAAEENRYRIDSEIVLRHHDVKLLGPDQVRGRAVWLVSALPRRGTPKPKRRSEWSLSQRIQYWIDQKTDLPLRVEAEQFDDYDGTRKGTLTRVETVEVEGVLLPESITSTSIRRSGREQLTQVTDQRYSVYRKFRAETVLLFTEPVPRSRF